MYSCETCKKQFSSKSSLNYHVREKHTHKRTFLLECTCCKQKFHSVTFNVPKNIYYTKCEECRELQRDLSTNHLEDGTFVYGLNKKCYFIDKGKSLEACAVYTCNNLLPCSQHTQEGLQQCISQRCNNCYVFNNFKACQKCRTRNHNSKNRLRQRVKEFKEELGGKCVDCGFDELFFLEFDHIDPSKKKKQITRSAPKDWEQEKDNLELRCGRCHRHKTAHKYLLNTKEDKYAKYKNKRKQLAHSVKIEIGKCQLCDWTVDNHTHLCAALDFDHIYDEKVKQVSNLYHFQMETLINEIAKTRLLCRHCHELYTCIQRGGAVLPLYYTSEEIDDFTKRLNCNILKKQNNDEIKLVLKKLI